LVRPSDPELIDTSLSFLKYDEPDKTKNNPGLHNMREQDFNDLRAEFTYVESPFALQSC